MTDDSFLAELGADWRRQNTTVDRLNVHIRKRLLRTRMALAAKLLGLIVALVAACWFVWLALHGAPAIFVLAGIVMLVALPLMILEIVGTARALKVGQSDTPSLVLMRVREQAAAARQLLWGAKASAVLLAASALTLLLLYWLGKARDEEAILFVPLWGFFALGLWLWQAHRSRLLSAEIAHCDVLLDEDREADQRLS
jgi:hypothetical protein